MRRSGRRRRARPMRPSTVARAGDVAARRASTRRCPPGSSTDGRRRCRVLVRLTLLARRRWSQYLDAGVERNQGRTGAIA